MGLFKQSAKEAEDMAAAVRQTADAHEDLARSVENIAKSQPSGSAPGGGSWEDFWRFGPGAAPGGGSWQDFWGIHPGSVGQPNESSFGPGGSGAMGSGGGNASGSSSGFAPAQRVQRDPRTGLPTVITHDPRVFPGSPFPIVGATPPPINGPKAENFFAQMVAALQFIARSMQRDDGGAGLRRTGQV